MNLTTLLGLYVANRNSRGMTPGQKLFSVLLALVGMVVVALVLTGIAAVMDGTA